MGKRVDLLIPGHRRGVIGNQGDDNPSSSGAQGRGHVITIVVSLFSYTGCTPVTLSDVGQQQRRERLNDYVESSFRLEGTRTPMVRPQTLVDMPLIGPVLLSFLVHIIILGWVAYQSPEKSGVSQGASQPQVEMVFDAPPTQHSLRGQRSRDDGGGSSSPAKSSSESSPTPVVPTPEQPSSPPVVRSPSGELADTSQDTKNLTPATPKHHKRRRAAPAHHMTRRQMDNNPFAHPMDLSFSGQPSPHPRHRGRRGGNHGAFDLSMGPLSMNGQINAPYQTRNSVKGVSSDYGEEIDRWIRNHMFYPEEARNAGEDGPSSVHVVIDRSGRVKSVRLTGQSGSYSLDTATVGLFQGVQLPPVPPDMAGDHFDLDVTINYILLQQ
ncbi:TonB family protein [Saccharibacter sp. 17.LH.SD]|uniref:energy transducer TonB n=1 Tax=Saccharibacter sp. 17.LH.SD TaxID=2689393 RepID=UPI00136B9146|nr:energy transducer TonB [Saccharibacter sp. 17.LH.SD]MXV45195.1 TonB family protein [Saccharibacter sp. 17.LH.SD]